ncbi:MAG: cytochrome c biogenesis protein CcsA [Flavobacteriales bacterium]|nr:cytochrome c biogenesis protein CcsA [Flavobacteriales bacterium]
MKNKILDVLASSKLALVLLLIFGISIGAATFIEERWDTITAKVLIYNARWFEVLIILLVINFILHIPKYKLLSKEKISTFLMHFALIVIIAGAAITRFTGFEGLMPIREGEKTNLMYSIEPYLQVFMADGKQRKAYYKHLYMTEDFDNDFDAKIKFEGHEDLKIEYVDFIPNATESFEEHMEGGKDILEIITADETGRVTLILQEGESKRIGPVAIAYKNKSDNPDDILVFKENGKLKVQSPVKIYTMKMATMKQDTISANTVADLEFMKLHNLAGIAQFVVKQEYQKAKKVLKPAQNKEEGTTDVLSVKISYQNQEKIIQLKGGNQRIPQINSFQIGDLLLQAGYGARTIPLPFSLHLNDFILDRYPGSMSPSSYKSVVTLFDERNNKRERLEIFMNNVLDYDGYRFFQSSYDQDELGTRLSVNHDKAGTFVTYFGYFLLILGFIFIHFDKNSRFNTIRRMIIQSRKKRLKSGLIVLFSMLSFAGFAQDSTHKHDHSDHDHSHHDHNHAEEKPSLGSQNHGGINMDRSQIGKNPNKKFIELSKTHADQFAKLLVQTMDGRFQPVNSLAIDILRKISKKDQIKTTDGSTQTAKQFILDVMINVDFWKNQKMIYLRDAGLAKDLGLGDSRYLSYNDLFSSKMEYKIQKQVEEAFRKDAAKQNYLDKEVIKLDERVNVFMMAMRGEFLKIFPKPNSPNHEWMTWSDSLAHAPIGAMMNDKQEVVENNEITYSSVLKLYIISLLDAKENGDYELSDKIVSSLAKIQRQKEDPSILPSEKQIEQEISYNQQNIFKKLQRYYSILALVLLVLAFADIVSKNKNTKKYNLAIKWPLRIFSGILFIAFAYHTYGMGMRWYLSGHAPWSNGYEALLLIAWAGLFSGFLFARYSKLTLAATALLAFFILMTASLSSYDPQLTNLQPVLKSYWLIIHVAALTISYGFFGLAFILGLINLILMIFVKKERFKYFNSLLTELTFVNEMNISIGLALATVGTFLGGIWANESWGRYWGWDSKETWAMVIILIYGMILHFRFIPKMKNIYTFNIASVWGFSTVLMTFFGVNYYLTKGLHSYARGETPVFPLWAWITIFVVLIISVLASRYNKLSK